MKRIYFIGLLIIFSISNIYSLEITRYVKTGGSGKGTSWSDAVGSINDAIDAVFRAGSGTIYIAPGTYSESVAIPSNSRNISLLGGYTEQNMDSPDFNNNKVYIKKANASLLSIGFSTKNITISGLYLDGGTNGVEVKTGSAGIIIDNITITNCTSFGLISNSFSGNDNVTVQNCTISKCKRGIEAGYAKIHNCIISDNYGGGMSVTASVVSNCTIINNKNVSATKSGTVRFYSDGGGVRACRSNFYRCRIMNNMCDGQGGGLYISGSGFSTYLFLCIIANNTAREGGGLFTIEPTNVESCTIINNQATEKGGGICIGQYGSDGFSMIGTILWNNKAKDKPEQYSIFGQKKFNIYSSAIQGGGVLPEIDEKNKVLDISPKNMDDDKPSIRLTKVVNFAGVALSEEQKKLVFSQDFTPTQNSICINRGSFFSDIETDRTLDYKGNPRVGKSDIGAFEYPETVN